MLSSKRGRHEEQHSAHKEQELVSLISLDHDDDNYDHDHDHNKNEDVYYDHDDVDNGDGGDKSPSLMTI